MFSLLLATAAPVSALHEILGPDFIVPNNNTFAADWETLPRLDFGQLNAPRAVDLDDVPASVQALYAAAGVQFLSVTYDQTLARSAASETALFGGSARLAACPPALDGGEDDLSNVDNVGPFLASSGQEIGQFAAGAVTDDGFSGFNVKFVESARQLQFAVQSNAGSAPLVVRTYLTSTNEFGDEVRVLQEETTIPTECAAADPADDDRVCAVNGRTADSFIVCLQADESCFDEVEILRATDATATEGFCVDDIMLGAIQHGRRFSLVVDEQGTREECGRSATLAPGDTVVSRFISITSAADAEWESVGVNHAPVLDNGELDLSGEQQVSVIRFGQLGEDFSNTDRVAFLDGKRAFRYWPNVNARNTFFEVTSFWLSDANPQPASFDAGGHWHPSTLCEPGCGGQGYTHHHAFSAEDRHGFTIEFYVTGTDADPYFADNEGNVIVDGEGHAEFQLATFDYRNVGGHPDETDFDLLRGHPNGTDRVAGAGGNALGPWYAPLEICAGPDVAHTFTTLAEWNACQDQRVLGADTYLPAAHLAPANVSSLDSLGCCGRVVFGCVFLGNDPATEHACLWYEITNQANATRKSIWDTFTELGAQVGTETDELISAIQLAGDHVREDIAEWAANVTLQLNLDANETREFIAQHFEDLTWVLLNETAKAQFNITQHHIPVNATIVREANETRANYLNYTEEMYKLINQSRIDLIADTELVNWAVPIINKATADTETNVALLRELIDLLDTMPSDIDAHSLAVIECAEKEILVRLLQLKARLASMDGERKSCLDDIKAQLTMTRIKLERSVDFMRRLSDTSSQSSE